MIYQTIAENLNDMENHRTDTQYEDNLITKVFLFQFVNSYASFFYISFIKEPFMDERCLGSNQHGIQKCGNATVAVDPATTPPVGFRWDVDKNDEAQFDAAGKIKFEPDPACMEELHTALLIIFVTRLVVGNVQEVVVPYFVAKLKARKEAKERRQEAAKMTLTSGTPDSSGGKATGTENLSEAEVQLNLADYQKGSGKDGTFEDYAEMIIQFGYASLFVVAFPLAPLLALMNNYVEIRVDAFKLLQLSKRAEPKGAEDIGTWYNILEIMATAAVVTNTLLVVFTAKSMFGDSRTQDKWVAFVLIEHAVLLIKFGFALAVEDVPEQVQMQLSRQDFLVTKTIEHVADDDDELYIKKGKLKMEILDRDDAGVAGNAEADFGVTALAQAGPTAGLAGTRADI
jgi:anoctamin-10/anoctamin-7